MSKQKSIFRASVNQFISEFIKPLREQSITQFSQAITFGSNQISSLGSSIEVSNYFNKFKIPILCANESGRPFIEKNSS